MDVNPIVAGTSAPQGLHGIAPLAFGTASASFRKSSDSVDAPLHSWGRIVWSYYVLEDSVEERRE
ncbi:MAG: hypothetical protein OXH99_03390 [Bryobacterales bacterium]|nr:hypothetical protein [Bryobacterales bacterium]